jgi:hypothetical protein
VLLQPLLCQVNNDNVCNRKSLNGREEGVVVLACCFGATTLATADGEDGFKLLLLVEDDGCFAHTETDVVDARDGTTTGVVVTAVVAVFGDLVLLSF